MITLDPSGQQHILIIRLSALGDVVYALPALAALRRYCPRAFIAWAVEETAAGLLTGHPQLDEVIVVPRKAWQKGLKRGRVGVAREAWRFRREMRSKRFDLAIDFQGNLRSGLLGVISGAKRKIGFAPPCSREGSRLLLNRAVKVKPSLHKVDRNLALLAELGVPVEGAEALFAPASDEDRRTIDNLLSRLGVSSPFVLIHPGVSRFGSFKQWPAENYSDLAQKLHGRGAAVVISAGPGEETLAGAIAADSESAAPAAGLSLSQLAELMRRAGAFVGSDTGPAQMAWMLGTPTVAMMGPKDPDLYGPMGAAHRKLTADVPCRPCTKRRCADNRCMTQITVDDVFDAAVSIMRGNEST